MSSNLHELGRPEWWKVWLVDDEGTVSCAWYQPVVVMHNAPKLIEPHGCTLVRVLLDTQHIYA